jgi:hypothetical protein
MLNKVNTHAESRISILSKEAKALAAVCPELAVSATLSIVVLFAPGHKQQPRRGMAHLRNYRRKTGIPGA